MKTRISGLLAASIIALAATAGAQETPKTKPEFALKTGGIVVVNANVKKEYFTARFSLRIFTEKLDVTQPPPRSEDERDTLHLRATLTGTQDGGAAAFSDPSTFRSVVAEVEYRKTISDTLQAILIGSVTFSAEGDEGRPIDPRMFTMFAGVRGSTAGLWLSVGAGFSGPVGSGLAFTARGGRAIGNGEAFFDFVLPIKNDALRARTWVLTTGMTTQVARGEIN